MPMSAAPPATPLIPTTAGSRVLTRSIGVSVLGNVFAPLAALATAPIMAQSLGVVGRGDAAAATAPLFLAISLATFGLPTAVTHFLSKNSAFRPELARRAVLLLLPGGLAVVGLVMALSRVLAAGESRLQGLIVLASLAILPSLLGALLQALAAGEQRWGLVAAERFITASARLAGFGGLALAGKLDVSLSVVILAAAPLAGAVVYLPMLARPRFSTAAPPGGAAPGPSTSDLMQYGLRVWLGGVAGVLLLRLDQALIGPISGAEVLGLYAVAATLADLPLVVNNAVRDVLFSADSARHDTERLSRAARLSTLVVAVVALGLGALLPWGLPMLFGSDFAAAVPVCWVLLAGLVVSNPGSVAGVGLSSLGRPGLRSLSLAIACVVNVSLVIALTPLCGALGAAVATAAGGFVAAWLNVLLLRRVSVSDVRGFVGVRGSDLVLLRCAASTVLSRFTPWRAGRGR